MPGTKPSPFAGLKIALPKNHDFDAAARCLKQAGSEVLRYPEETELSMARPIETWFTELTQREYDDVVFPSRQSIQLLLELGRVFDKEEQLLAALRHVRKIAQGQRAADALAQNGISADVRCSEPTFDSLAPLLRSLQLEGRVVGIASRAPDARLVELLEERGAAVRVLSDDGASGAAAQMLDEITGGRVRVIAFGSQSDVTRLWESAALRGQMRDLKQALSKMRVVSIGSAAALELKEREIRVDAAVPRTTFIRPHLDDLVSALTASGGRATAESEATPIRNGTGKKGSGRKTVVVVGNGMVGHRFCERLVEYDKKHVYDVVTFCEEPRPAYDRVRLTSWFETRDASALRLADPEWYKAKGIRLLVGERASKISRKHHAVLSSSGEWIPYDYAVLCTGSLAFVPPLPGMDRQGVFVYRTIEDLEQIVAHSARARRAIVMGGGLLGLEAAKAVLDLGLETHVVEAAPRLMPRQLDTAGAKLLERAVSELGVRVHTNRKAARIVGERYVCGLEFQDGETLEAELLIVAAGIRPRDDLARDAGLKVAERGGIVVDDALCTSDPRIFAIGECASHRDLSYGLVAPCYDMADIVARNLTGEMVAFEGADQSAKLKLLGVEVASFGDPFVDGADYRAVVYEDLVRGVYKKLLVTSDAKRVVGGILVGDAAEYAQLSSLTKTAKELTAPPHELIIGKSGLGGSAAELDDDVQVCSCNNVTKRAICNAIREGGCSSVGEVKGKTRAGAGCGGCTPLVTDILSAELRAAGKAVKNHLCEHFAYSRRELYEIVKINRVRSFEQLLASHGQGQGCEVCKPAVASILASVFNEPILNHEALQDTNDRFLANIQRTGLYSVVPRIPAGEITPEKLIKIGEIAKRYGLYTKITGGQRIDLFGARLNQLPDIWEELVNAGFESGHAYGKAMRTVKSCVGSTWCRYGVQDSVRFAIRVEERYKGLRAPHKLKSAVSGCVRECAEAQSKDFGLIATERGWNLYVCGNGGAKPRHADLLASDLDEDTAIKYIDRFLMYYIATADKLTRTATWLDKLDGGLEYLKDVVINDRLGICAQLEKDMQYLVDSFTCEWADVVRDPVRRARFRHFANSDEPDSTVEFVTERDQRRPADWLKAAPINTNASKVRLPLLRTSWVRVARVQDVPKDGSITIKHGTAQLAIFNFASRGEWYACQNMCPHTRDMVLARGIIGDQAGQPKVACPMHKKTFSLATGDCLSGEPYSIRTFPVKIEKDAVFVELPPIDELERLLDVRKPKQACATQACSAQADATQQSI